MAEPRTGRNRQTTPKATPDAEPRASAGGRNTTGGAARDRAGPSRTDSKPTDTQRAAGSDQERERTVSREQGGAMGTGVQREGRGGTRDSAMRDSSTRDPSMRDPSMRDASLRGQRSPDAASLERLSVLSAFMANPGLMAGAFMSNPYAFAQTMSEEMERLFSSFGGDELATPLGGGRPEAPVSGPRGGRLQPSPRGAGATGWMPQMELFQRGDEIVIRADLPGLTPDDVQIVVEDGYLTVSGERRQTSEDRQEGFYRTERSYGSFARTIALPEGIDETQVAASFEHGVLEVTAPMPQPRQQRGRRVEIGRGGGAQAGRSARAMGSAQQTDESPAGGRAPRA